MVNSKKKSCRCNETNSKRLRDHVNSGANHEVHTILSSQKSTRKIINSIVLSNLVANVNIRIKQLQHLNDTLNRQETTTVLVYDSIIMQERSNRDTRKLQKSWIKRELKGRSPNAHSIRRLYQQIDNCNHIFLMNYIRFNVIPLLLETTSMWEINDGQTRKNRESHNCRNIYNKKKCMDARSTHNSILRIGAQCILSPSIVIQHLYIISKWNGSKR